jgi:hypothetical protein
MLRSDDAQLTIFDLLRPERPIARRRRRPHQLGLRTGYRRTGRCEACASELEPGRLDCDDCGGFTCPACDEFTSANGAAPDGQTCAACAV